MICKAQRHVVTGAGTGGNIGREDPEAMPIDALATPNVLLVDDDRELTGMLAEYLAREGFRVAQVHDAAAAIDPDAVTRADVMVLDVMLPGGSGLDVLRTLRGRGSRLPILMLTARGDDVDRIVGLELGADDYLPKPFNPRELVARLRAVLRRVVEVAQAAPERLCAGSLVLDHARHRVELGGRAVELTGAEFRVLAELMKAPGRVLGRDELTERALGRPLEAYDRSIDTHVSNLRRKLGLDAERGPAIRGIRGVGYVLSVPDAVP
jgi:DNA-binding response OmpR family regulator